MDGNELKKGAGTGARVLLCFVWSCVYECSHDENAPGSWSVRGLGRSSIIFYLLSNPSLNPSVCLLNVHLYSLHFYSWPAEKAHNKCKPQERCLTGVNGPLREYVVLKAGMS